MRDASYLNWKYVDQPGQTFVRLEITDGGPVVGVAVWMVRPPDGVYRYGRAFLVDLVAPLSDEARLQQIIKAACRGVEGDGVDALLCHHIGPALTRALRGVGFHLRQPERYLLVDTEGLPACGTRHRALRREVVRDPRRLRHRSPVVRRASRWAVATAVGATAVTVVDAVLLERSKGFFRGGFLSEDYLEGPVQTAVFLLVSLLVDAAFIGLVVALVTVRWPGPGSARRRRPSRACWSEPAFCSSTTWWRTRCCVTSATPSIWI